MLAEVLLVTTIHSVNLATWVSRNACVQLLAVRAWNSYVEVMDKCTKMNAHYENGPARTRFMSLSLILDRVSEIFDFIERILENVINLSILLVGLGKERISPTLGNFLNVLNDDPS